jgi:hypothetical protein
MSIHLKQPYKIVEPKRKRYTAHYLIPADKSLVVPVKLLGPEVSCDVRWEDENGELQHLTNLVFINDNLLPVDEFIDPKLHELWQHYYN